ncbi:hypothetical protein FHU31_000235 [Mycolicibacterium fluoranthenivorans]|uniref:Uncharacterized protein n=1 Tax=Mycolicibacterium fluoranthenivorans TaxID=258505 RepID=A0A7X5R4N8_9MYCO|nr:hypothetical protein [Mycolicibacterium fluoranthenivorans]
MTDILKLDSVTMIAKGVLALLRDPVQLSLLRGDRR